MDIRHRLARPMLAAAGLVAIAAPAVAQLWSPLDNKPSPSRSGKLPALRILCLPPGGAKAMPCTSASAGETIRLDTGLDGSPPLTIVLVPVGSSRKPSISKVTISPRPLPGSGGSYLLTLPRHWCTAHSDVQFKIQMLTSEMQNSQSARSGDADSIGSFQMRC